MHGREAQPKHTKAVRGWQGIVTNGWGGQGAQHKGPKIVKGLSHEILNGMMCKKVGWGARSAQFCVMKAKKTNLQY